MYFDAGDRKFLTHKEALKHSGISESTLRRYRKKGLIKAYWVGGLRFSVQELDNLYDTVLAHKKRS